jgi:CobQ-like glutamine amidotransferase family enzyme
MKLVAQNSASSVPSFFGFAVLERKKKKGSERGIVYKASRLYSYWHGSVLSHRNSISELGVNTAVMDVRLTNVGKSRAQ